MKILIVSKEAGRQGEIRTAFEAGIEKVEVLEAQIGLEAIKLVKRHEPDFLFLDIYLSNESGLEIAELLHQLELKTKLILIGEEAKYAIDAFRLRAFYYLLTPFQPAELAFLVQLSEKEYRKKCEASLHKLPIESHDRIFYISPHDIVYVSKNKENKTVSIYTKCEMYTSTYTLQELEEKLLVYNFLRVHKSYLINLQYVRELQPYYNGTYNLYFDLEIEHPIPVSRNYVKYLRSRLEI